MVNPSETPGFKKLLSEWNQKLLESGFHDLEMSNGNLKQSGTCIRFKMCDEEVRELKSKYYSLVMEYVNETIFEKELERQIMTLYAEGIQQVVIKERLKIEGHRYKVYEPIHRWLRKWGLK